MILRYPFITGSPGLPFFATARTAVAGGDDDVADAVYVEGAVVASERAVAAGGSVAAEAVEGTEPSAGEHEE